MSTQALTPLVAGNATLWLTLNVFGEQLGLPVPAYPSLLVMGAAADEAELLLALLASVAVTGVADLLWYWAGRRHGAWLLRHLPGHHVPAATRLPGLLLVAKFVPGAAVLATLSAGASAMPLRRFLAYDLGGATLWIGSGLALGRLFEQHILALLAALKAYGPAPLLLAGLLGLALLGWHLLARRHSRPSPSRQYCA
ncbi:DedA family protein [Pseudomonas sp. JBR1]|uniref:DedA family protein n=1 Tax=Pseudomonas sp. JBR1 TaxID=3020907 RepID=UPI00230615E5|nr:VTT domain-containing protein [Pseudomonas sp. JBR1]WCE07926.1 VTT domain-containing protein [Pseudomonas sp. JBR1]